MSAAQNIIALIFDFDDTLTDDSTTKLLEHYGVDVEDFWNVKVKRRVDEGWDHALAYLDLLLDLVGDGKPLGNLSNNDLREFGSGLEFYRGIPEIFDSLNNIAANCKKTHPSIEYYIISGGLEEIIRGCSINRYFSGIWGCCFEEKNGTLSRIKNAISFTEKTKYLYYINKGLGESARYQQYSVNGFVDKTDRRIPFTNMIYIGDGLTDVPCFSLIEHFSGKAFGVFDPKRKGSPKKAWEQLVAPKRVKTMNSPHYREDDDLGALLHAVISEICSRLETNSRSAF